ncbi:hypothetical protein [Dysgonomonas macrotermitis]|uniref:Bacteriophage CI repressor helix-turn-helix domain-containing protein n=1 Tax=Dysgonomonas macrotermitis TaxID=1346286 RepID=A0A1M4SDX4_9BACT|nr:hypothetical protein [Dysgonomonas macrotermitis]SHE30410.1 hypothetical protein SAMN05444362_10135 [Dysgonomonas macrotermitis]
MNINERIQCIVDQFFSGNKAAFAKCIKVKPTTLSNIIGRERASKPSSEILESIAYNIPELNPDWLLTGQGDMLRMKEIGMFIDKNKGAINTGTVGGHNVNITGSDYEKIIDKNRIELTSKGAVSEVYLQKITSLESEIAKLESVVKSKNEVIEALKDHIASLKSK